MSVHLFLRCKVHRSRRQPRPHRSLSSLSMPPARTFYPSTRCGPRPRLPPLRFTLWQAVATARPLLLVLRSPDPPSYSTSSNCVFKGPAHEFNNCCHSAPSNPRGHCSLLSPPLVRQFPSRYPLNPLSAGRPRPLRQPPSPIRASPHALQVPSGCCPLLPERAPLCGLRRKAPAGESPET